MLSTSPLGSAIMCIHGYPGLSLIRRSLERCCSLRIALPLRSAYVHSSTPPARRTHAERDAVRSCYITWLATTAWKQRSACDGAKFTHVHTPGRGEEWRWLVERVLV